MSSPRQPGGPDSSLLTNGAGGRVIGGTADDHAILGILAQMSQQQSQAKVQSSGPPASSSSAALSPFQPSHSHSNHLMHHQSPYMSLPPLPTLPGSTSSSGLPHAALYVDTPPRPSPPPRARAYDSNGAGAGGYAGGMSLEEAMASARGGTTKGPRAPRGRTTSTSTSAASASTTLPAAEDLPPLPPLPALRPPFQLKEDGGGASGVGSSVDASRETSVDGEGGEGESDANGGGGTPGAGGKGKGKAPAKSRGRKPKNGTPVVGTPSAEGAGGEGQAEVDWSRTRKDNHKEVERRRRETINEGINELKLIVPGCDKNKGSILKQAVKYISELKEAEGANIERWTLEKLLSDQAMGVVVGEREGWRRCAEEREQERDRAEEECRRLRRRVEELGGEKVEESERRVEGEREAKRQRVEGA